VLTQTTFAPLLQHLPFVAGIDTFDRRSGLHAVWATRRALRREPIDIAIDLQGNWKSAFLARLAKARDCVGLRGKWRQEPLSSLLLRRRLDAAGEPHPARAALALVREFAPEAEALPPQLVATPTEIAREQDAVRVLGIAPERPFAGRRSGRPSIAPPARDRRTAGAGGDAVARGDGAGRGPRGPRAWPALAAARARRTAAAGGPRCMCGTGRG
jgi:ADP-heptose:LPS heptosyltransferase